MSIIYCNWIPGMPKTGPKKTDRNMCRKTMIYIKGEKSNVDFWQYFPPVFTGQEPFPRVEARFLQTYRFYISEIAKQCDRNNQKILFVHFKLYPREV